MKRSEQPMNDINERKFSVFIIFPFALPQPLLAQSYTVKTRCSGTVGKVFAV